MFFLTQLLKDFKEDFNQPVVASESFDVQPTLASDDEHDEADTPAPAAPEPVPSGH